MWGGGGVGGGEQVSQNKYRYEPGTNLDSACIASGQEERARAPPSPPLMYVRVCVCVCAEHK